MDFSEEKTIALAGNPNSGKTTLFNSLTGTYQKTGNWTGVTTEKKIGKLKKDKSISVVDLPGLYSLSTHGEDEKAVTDYLNSTPPKAIINIVDGTNLERNLYLTTELLELNIPIAASSAIIAEIVSAETSPGTAIISRPTEHTQVIASNLSNVRTPFLVASIIPSSSETGINAPERPPTEDEAITPPFFTASLRRARAAVVP